MSDFGIMESLENHKRKHEESFNKEEELKTKRPLLDEEPSASTYKLTDLPDQVLLDIFKYLNARDLKALAYAHVRFGNVITDRTLWTKVVAGSDPIGPKRLYWMLSHGLGESTSTLRLEGHAKSINGCNGYFHYKRPIFIYETEEEKRLRLQKLEEQSKSGQDDAPTVINMPVQHRDNGASYGHNGAGPSIIIAQEVSVPQPPGPVGTVNAYQILYDRTDSAGNVMPKWPNYIQKQLPGSRKPVTKPFTDLQGCNGPRFTFTYPMLKSLTIQCPNLRELHLEFCNFNYMTTNLMDFPKNLTNLSLRGSKIYNMCRKDSMLGQINIYLRKLEVLDLSDCDWVEPEVMMPLSKLEQLKMLFLRNCVKLRDFVAYASLSTRHGFKNLRVIDYRGSPVGDSEISPLGWLPNLTYMLLSPMVDVDNPTTHKHYKDDPIFIREELNEWELDIPPYFERPRPDATEDKIPRPPTITNPPPNWTQPNYQKRTSKEKKVREPIEITEEYYVTTGLDYEKARLKEEHGVDFENFLVDESESEDESEIFVPYEGKLGSETTLEIPNKDLEAEISGNSIPRNILTFNGDNVRFYHVDNVNRENLLHIMTRPPIAGQPNRGPIQCFRFSRDNHSMVSDSCIMYFGHGLNVNIILMNRNRAQPGEMNMRPSITNLKGLILRGFSKITDSTLNHLKTAAPHLKFLDIRETSCTEAGVENFKLFRPGVRVIFKEDE